MLRAIKAKVKAEYYDRINKALIDGETLEKAQDKAWEALVERYTPEILFEVIEELPYITIA